jgi:predicted kinase
MSDFVIYMLRGLPASGKTTLARRYVEQGVKRVSKDDLRNMLQNGKYTPGLERFIRAVRNTIIIEAINEGFSVIVDDCNLNPEHEKELRYLTDYLGVRLIIIDIPTSLDECIARDKARINSVGEDVIRGMYEKYYAELPELEEE